MKQMRFKKGNCFSLSVFVRDTLVPLSTSVFKMRVCTKVLGNGHLLSRHRYEMFVYATGEVSWIDKKITD